MTTGSNSIPATTHTPLRGTQSLVGVMSFVLKHPSLLALELLWRWLAAAPLLYLAWRTLAPAFAAIPLDTLALQNMTFFEPVRSAHTLAHQATLYLPALQQTGKWWIPLALLTWTVAAALGRTTILRRANHLWPPEATSSDPVQTRVSQVPSLGPGSLQRRKPSLLRPRIPSVALFTLLRALAFLFTLAFWSLAIRAAIHATITQHGDEPNLVLFTAEAVLLTFLAFALWSTTVWALDLSPIRHMAHTTLAPQQKKLLRAKLIETNFVMGIVRVILLVLSLTFSASPLPFQTQETQAYINVWWTGVALFYLLSSDFFHVVRRVTYLRLLQSIAVETNGPAPHAS